MIIRSFDDSDAGGFDPRNYKTIGVSGGANINEINTYFEVLNITGEGFIELANAYSTASVSTLNIVLTIDGTNYTFSGGNGGGAKGFCLEKYVLAKYETSGSPTSIVRAQGIGVTEFWSPVITKNFNPLVNAYPGHMATSPLPIFFNDSLIVRLMYTTGSTTPLATAFYDIKGGLLI